MSSLKTQFITHNPFSTCLEIPPLWRVEDGPFTGFGIRGQEVAEGGWQWTWQRRSQAEATLHGSFSAWVCDCCGGLASNSHKLVKIYRRYIFLLVTLDAAGDLSLKVVALKLMPCWTVHVVSMWTETRPARLAAANGCQKWSEQIKQIKPIVHHVEAFLFFFQRAICAIVINVPADPPNPEPQRRPSLSEGGMSGPIAAAAAGTSRSSQHCTSDFMFNTPSFHPRKDWNSGGKGASVAGLGEREVVLGMLEGAGENCLARSGRRRKGVQKHKIL